MCFDGEEKVEAVAGGMAMEVITDGDQSPPHRLDHREERVDVSSSSVLYPVCSMMLLLAVWSISASTQRRRFTLLLYYAAAILSLSASFYLLRVR